MKERMRERKKEKRRKEIKRQTDRQKKEKVRKEEKDQIGKLGKEAKKWRQKRKSMVKKCETLLSIYQFINSQRKNLGREVKIVLISLKPALDACRHVMG